MPYAPARADRLTRLHRCVGLAAAPFITLSLLLAVALTHPAALHATSARLFDSRAIPAVALAEPVRPGAIDQTVALVARAHGARPNVVVLDRTGLARVGGFAGGHDHAGSRAPRHTTYVVDIRRQAIVRVEDLGNSLFLIGHGIHAYQWFGIDGLNLASVTACALLALLTTGLAMRVRDRRAGRSGSPPLRWHARLGLWSAPFTLVIAVTTLMFDFPALLPAPDPASRPIPALALAEPLHPGSLDQAAQLAERALGSRPHSYYLGADGRVKLAGFGADIAGDAVVVDTRSMRIERIEDWRNNPVSAAFIVHDGRYLGGLDGFNIMDAVALVLFYLTWGGAAAAWRRWRLRRRGAGEVGLPG
ncbi:PepSY domain-containing protein [Parasulfuritortus cantonensis]|uniref:PepSY domain-containing protein n=1 Tax=Parasulfuritortus cantonensis TaxID=2528202 RepID=A0A4R1BDI9_9PROT|nr:PepSY domain-containing protein [Parasulfuritortus cantonensis]TCJ15176.1 PepSY domain-containing protein [Parasulfuritortus cantonensis]